MHTRSAATDLPSAAFDAFVAAVNELKRPDPATGISEYDRVVALHGAVMAVRVTFDSGDFQDVNMAHWNIGFLPWHRQYLRWFEAKLQAIDPDVTLPYWDWEAGPAATDSLFGPELVGSLGPTTGPRAVTDGRFADLAVAPALAEQWGTTLTRGGGSPGAWPPQPGSTEWLTALRVGPPDFHPLWIFWQIIEAGWPNVFTASHNAGHNMIGGHMAGAFSPNDPVFWMHHANVDRLWHLWQQRYRDEVAAEPGSDWPAPADGSPLDGRQAPYGHRINDLMWPWVGAFSGAFASRSTDPATAELLHDPATLDAVRVRDVLDIADLDYSYD